MNPHFVKKYLPFGVQDSQSAVLLFFFLLLPITALLPHGHLLCALWVALLLAVGARVARGRGTFCEANARLYAVFLAFCLSGMLLSTARWETLLSFFLRLSFFLPLFFPKRKREMCRMLSLVGGVLGMLALGEIVLGGGDVGYNDPSLFPALPRARGILGNPNASAALLLPPSLFALDDLLFDEKNKAFSFLCLLGSALGIAASYSRGALIALFLSSLLLFSRRFGARHVLITLLSFAPLLLLLLPEALTARLFSVFSPDSSVLYRFSLWRSVFRLPARTLVFGVGEGKGAMLEALSPVLAAGLLHIEHTHSIFLHLLLSSGIIGLFLFLCLCAKVLLGGKERGARAALFALLLFGIFDDPLYLGQTEVLFWLTLGLA